MTLFVGIDIEDLYTQVKLPTTITKYNVDTGEPYSVDAGLYKFTVGDLTFDSNYIENYDWESLGLDIIYTNKQEYSCHKHKSLLDYYVGCFLYKSKHYNIGEWNDRYECRDNRDLILYENIEHFITFTKEKLSVITSQPNIVVLYRQQLERKYESKKQIPLW